MSDATDEAVSFTQTFVTLRALPDRRSPLRGMVADRLDWDRRAAGRPRYRSTTDNFVWQHDMYTKMMEEEEVDKQHDDESRVKYEAIA